MKDIPILREAEPGIGFRRQLLQDPASDGADVARSCAEFCKNDSCTRNKSVEDRHLSLFLDRFDGMNRDHMKEKGFRISSTKKNIHLNNIDRLEKVSDSIDRAWLDPAWLSVYLYWLVAPTEKTGRESARALPQLNRAFLFLLSSAYGFLRAFYRYP